MERLVSAFRDKFESPNSYYHPVFGSPSSPNTEWTHRRRLWRREAAWPFESSSTIFWTCIVPWEWTSIGKRPTSFAAPATFTTTSSGRSRPWKKTPTFFYERSGRRTTWRTPRSRTGTPKRPELPLRSRSIIFRSWTHLSGSGRMTSTTWTTWCLTTPNPTKTCTNACVLTAGYLCALSTVRSMLQRLIRLIHNYTVSSSLEIQLSITRSTSLIYINCSLFAMTCVPTRRDSTRYQWLAHLSQHKLSLVYKNSKPITTIKCLVYRYTTVVKEFEIKRN